MHKTMISVMIWVWLALAIVGLITDSDPVYIVGLVNSTINLVGFGILNTFEANKSQ